MWVVACTVLSVILHSWSLPRRSLWSCGSGGRCSCRRVILVMNLVIGVMPLLSCSIAADRGFARGPRVTRAGCRSVGSGPIPPAAWSSLERVWFPGGLWTSAIAKTCLVQHFLTSASRLLGLARPRGSDAPGGSGRVGIERHFLASLTKLPKISGSRDWTGIL